MLSESPLPTSSQEHAQLLKALRESELLRELSELLASSLDPTRILQVLVRRTTEVCDVERCAVWLLDESQQRLQPSAYHFSTQHVKRKVIQVADRMWHHSALSFDDPIFHRLLQENGILALEDLRTEQSMHLIAEKFFVRSVLLVALVREDRPVGMMSLDNFGQTTIFSEEQQQLARVIGQQAAVAIDNAYLYQRAQTEHKRAQRLIERARSIYEVAMAVNSGEDLSRVLEIAAQHLVRNLDAQSAGIALLEKDALTLVTTTAPSLSLPRLLADGPTSPSLSSLPQCATAMKQGTPHFVTKEQFTETEMQWFQRLGMENVLIVPLMADSQTKSSKTRTRKQAHPPSRSVGVTFVHYTQAQTSPTHGQLAFAQDIAAQCALAIEKTHILAQAQQAVALANERANTLNAVFNAMTEGIVVLDMEGKVIVSNDTAAHFLGLTRDPKKHLTHYLQNYQTYTLYGQPIPKEDFPLIRALHGEYIRGERFMTKRSDGSEASTEVNIVPLLDDEEKQIGIVSAFRDITEPLRVERRIRLALDTMLHAAEAVSGITDIKEILYRVLAMTLAALNGERGVVQLYNSEDQTFSLLLSIGFQPDEIAPWLAAQRRWLLPEEKRYASIRTQLMDGHAILVSIEPEQADTVRSTLLAAPITYNRSLLGVMMLDRTTPPTRQAAQQEPTSPRGTQPLAALEFSAWDIAVVEGIAQFAGLAIEQTRWQHEAEVARTNEATMREANMLKDEFLAITAHEFRTPLTIILAHSQMMGRQLHKVTKIAPELQGRFQESILSIEEQTRQLTNIVNTFLEVTRLNKGLIELDQEEIHLDDMVKEVVANYKTTSSAHQISYEITPCPAPYILLGDRPRLVQIFANLIQNAIKYSPLGGPITITLIQRANNEERMMIEVQVADKGIGIAQEAQLHLFERFYRAPDVERSKTRGIGLGLYVVAEFVYLHGGTIRVESSGVPGEGSRFIFTLPLLVQNTGNL